MKPTFCSVLVASLTLFCQGSHGLKKYATSSTVTFNAQMFQKRAQDLCRENLEAFGMGSSTNVTNRSKHSTLLRTVSQSKNRYNTSAVDHHSAGIKRHEYINPNVTSHSRSYHKSRLVRSVSQKKKKKRYHTSVNGYHGKNDCHNPLGIFQFLLFLVYVLQLLQDLMLNTAMTNIPINGEEVTLLQALILALLGGVRGNASGNQNVNNNNNSNNDNNNNNNNNNG